MGNTSRRNAQRFEINSTDDSKFSNIKNNRVRHTHAWRANHDLINNVIINKPSGDDEEDRDNGGWTV